MTAKLARLLAALCLPALVYTAALPPANAGEPAALAGRAEELATGAMSKLVLHGEPRDPLTAAFVDGDGAAVSLADFAGRAVVMNFWATWCPPCRAEMPSLDRLAAALAAEGLPAKVVAVSTDFGSVEKSRRFYEEEGIATLGLYHDANRTLAREAAILGLPVTLLLDREGREVGRLVGDAEWDSEEAKAVVRALAGAGGS